MSEKANRRRFTRQQRDGFFLEAGGKCQGCGQPLEAGWHADHIVAHARGGATDEYNGQALCPRCNQQKGVKLEKDLFTPRWFQARIEAELIQAVERGQKFVMAHIFCGLGKTLGALNGGNALYRLGKIDALAYVSPRTNLAIQAETDWEEWHEKFGEPRMGKIVRRMELPLIRGTDQFGVSFTYQALMAAENNAKGNRFAQELQGRRFMLVLDEAQQLGMDEAGGTRSAEAVARLAEQAEVVLLMTGTPYRSDGKKLFKGNYSEPDAEGNQYLVADATATLTEGIGYGQLRDPEFQLFDAWARRKWLVGDGPGATEEVQLSQVDKGLLRILEHPRVWQPAVDQLVRQIRQHQAIHPALCGALAAQHQAGATEIMKYLRQAHPGIKALLAISNESMAQDNLRAFKKGGYDLLVTVGMAHMGFDHKPISSVLVLSPVREYGWLAQFIGRGLRVWDGANVSLVVLIPDDPKAQEFVAKTRAATEEGLRLREEREPGGDGPRDPLPGPICLIEDAGLLERRSLGMDPAKDLTPGQLLYLEQHKERAGQEHLSNHQIAAVLTAMGHPIPETEIPTTTPPPSGQTQVEQEKAIRAVINQDVSRGVRLMKEVLPGYQPSIAWAEIHRTAQRKLRRELRQLSEYAPEELPVVARLVREDWLPSIRRRVSGQEGAPAT